jgi:hypothetical protein
MPPPERSEPGYILLRNRPTPIFLQRLASQAHAHSRLANGGTRNVGLRLGTRKSGNYRDCLALATSIKGPRRGAPSCVRRKFREYLPLAPSCASRRGMASRAAIARPAGVVRSRASVTETKPTPRCSSSWRVAISSVTDRRGTEFTDHSGCDRSMEFRSPLARSVREELPPAIFPPVISPADSLKTE